MLVEIQVYKFFSTRQLMSGPDKPGDGPQKQRRPFRPRRRPKNVTSQPVTGEGSTLIQSGEPLPPNTKPTASQNQTEKRDRRPGYRKGPSVNNAGASGSSDISREIRRGYDCMICMSEVKFYQAIWSCTTCYKLFHLNCTHQWIKRNVPKSKTPSEPFEWRCPGCQYVYIEPTLPQFKCFCGRIENPTPSRQAPFSCGEPCAIPRTTCSHSCILSCHPGPCPPCPVFLPKCACFCGREPVDGSKVRCGDSKSVPYSCGSVCGRLLNCGMHTCEDRCHAECGPCSKIVGTVSCFCGNEQKDILCGGIVPEIFSCGKAKPVLMNCKSHRFMRVCGPTEDLTCPLSPEQFSTCACRSNASVKSRTSCTDPIETCTEKRTVDLACGHQAVVGCQLSSNLVPLDQPAPKIECIQPVTQLCRCTRAKRSVRCHETGNEFLCTQPCRTYKTCTKCKCDVICCPNFGRRDYGAENHICYTICDKSLNCGIHKCDEIHHLGHCKRCSVIAREPLVCGCGLTRIEPPYQCGTTLPACPGMCNKQLACGHRDLSRCHPGPCAPCTLLVSKPCAGGHQTLHQIPCFAENVACNLKCGKLLSCGQHADKSGCHAGPCQACSQLCGRKLEFCEHDCMQACSHGSTCSLEPCRARVIVTCACGLHTEEVQCRGCESNPFPVQTQLACTSECAIAQRQAALRQAFRPDEIPDDEAEQYSGELVALAEKHDKFIRLLDSSLIAATETRARTLNLPPTDQIKRYLTLEYVQIHYRFDAEVIREGDGLHVAIHFVPGATRVPQPPLSSLLDMLPSQTLKYIVDIDPDGPQIHLYDVARGYGKLTIERINRELKEFIGAYRTRRGEGFNMYLDFFDANKAVAAFRKLQACSGLDQCRLVNVFLERGEADDTREVELDQAGKTNPVLEPGQAPSGEHGEPALI